ncbi:hypothetical protein niasHT_032762 [Heterodera trifolii]|uniref:Uncharacterized protein n=1 Tax=Heterodera trifolii TaxID=157864 RepID=A0ABD2IH67_9BILA
MLLLSHAFPPPAYLRFSSSLSPKCFFSRPLCLCLLTLCPPFPSVPNYSEKKCERGGAEGMKQRLTTASSRLSDHRTHSLHIMPSGHPAAPMRAINRRSGIAHANDRSEPLSPMRSVRWAWPPAPPGAEHKAQRRQQLSPASSSRVRQPISSS